MVATQLTEAPRQLLEDLHHRTKWACQSDSARKYIPVQNARDFMNQIPVPSVEIYLRNNGFFVVVENFILALQLFSKYIITFFAVTFLD